MLQKKTFFDEKEALHHLSHYLPAQNPLKDFIHHNTLHAFQKDHFHEALWKGTSIFGYKTYLSLTEFRKKYQNKDIKHEVLDRMILKHKGDTLFESWKNKLLVQDYHESMHPLLGRLRGHWKKHYGINLEKATHDLLFRILCSYLDQGVSYWVFPVHENGFLDSIKELETKSFQGIFVSNRVKDLLQSNVTITDLLHILVGNEQWFEAYLFDQQFKHPGWSGMVATVEKNPKSLLDKRVISLKDLIIFELLLEIDALDQKFQEKWEPLSTFVKNQTFNLFDKIPSNELFEVYKIWQEAFEWSFYDQVLVHLKENVIHNSNRITQPKTFQALLCMDDRECSFRRNLEILDENIQTFGTAAYFNFEFFLQPFGSNFYTKSCPAPVDPKYLIKELSNVPLPPSSRTKHFLDRVGFSKQFDRQKKALVSGFLLLFQVFKPRVNAETNASFRYLSKNSKLLIENQEHLSLENGLQQGFKIQEMADRIENLFRSIGLVTDFSDLVYIIGHGATSVNNTHYAGYDCGACSGRPSITNAIVASYAANHLEVRKILRERGINIPEKTQFIPALHDTTRDEIYFYEEQILSSDNKNLHHKNQLTFAQALQNNAHERARRLDTIDDSCHLDKVHEKVKMRSVSLFEPRPELNHATNALCIVGHSNLVKSLFLDRRAFLNSYDDCIDPEGVYLTTILGQVAPVAGGINLEYYFSRVDNEKLGAGSKLPHNVMGLIGVANGIDGDLRSGLPLQMIELHDPIRLLALVESTPEKVLAAISKNKNILEWYQNEWLRLVCFHPQNHTFHVFENGMFHPYELHNEIVYRMEKNMSWSPKKTQNLPIGILK